jgi:flotillin
MLGIEIWQMALAFVVFTTAFFLVFAGAMARFLKRPSPSEAIIRIGRATTDVFIGRACWIVPVLHRAATLSLSTIGLTIRREGHEALVTKDFISTNLSAEFYIRVEPNEDDVKKAARTIGIDEGHASTDAIRTKAQELLEPKLIGAIRAVAAQNEFLALHLNREHFAQEVSNALREDLGRNGFTLESVTITELTQTPLSELRSDDIFGASGRETVTNTVVEKNVAVRRKLQEEAERSAEIAREQEINVAQQTRMMREGKAKEEEAAVKAELAQREAIETRDLQRQANIAVERSRKEQTEQAAAIGKQKVVEAAQVDKERSIEAALVDKQITLTLKAKESAEAEAQKAAAVALKEKADQEVLTVGRVAEAERQRRVSIVDAQRQAEQHKIAADVEAYRKKVEAQAAAEAAELQALSITKLAEANREAGLKEAEVLREKNAAANSKSTEILVQETALTLLQYAPTIVRELVKPAEKIGEIKVLQVGGALGGGAGPAGNGFGPSSFPLLGGALGPVAKSIFEASALLPVLKEVMKFSGMEKLEDALTALQPSGAQTPAAKPAARAGVQPAPASATRAVTPLPAVPAPSSAPRPRPQPGS